MTLKIEFMHCHKNSHLSHLLRSTNLLIGLVVLYLIRAFKWSLNCYESFTIIRRVITITNTQFHLFLHLFPKEKAIKLYCLSQLDIISIQWHFVVRWNICMLYCLVFEKEKKYVLVKLSLIQFTELKICTNRE